MFWYGTRRSDTFQLKVHQLPAWQTPLLIWLLPYQPLSTINGPLPDKELHFSEPFCTWLVQHEVAFQPQGSFGWEPQPRWFEPNVEMKTTQSMLDFNASCRFQILPNHRRLPMDPGSNSRRAAGYAPELNGTSQTKFFVFLGYRLGVPRWHIQQGISTHHVVGKIFNAICTTDHLKERLAWSTWKKHGQNIKSGQIPSILSNWLIADFNHEVSKYSSWLILRVPRRMEAYLLRVLFPSGSTFTASWMKTVKHWQHEQSNLIHQRNLALPGGGGALAMSAALHAGRYKNFLGWYSGSLMNCFVLQEPQWFEVIIEES